MYHSEKQVIEKDEFAVLRHKAMTHHEARIIHDNDPIIFKWHFQKGMLDKRMSGLELAIFIIPHMQSILDCRLLSDNLDIENEFRNFLVRIATTPKEKLDEVLPWLQVEYRKEEDDLITLNASEMVVHSKRLLYSY